MEVFQIGNGAKYVLLVYSGGGGPFLTITTYVCLLATNHFLAQFEDLFQNMCTKAYFMCGDFKAHGQTTPPLDCYDY